jgi:type II secretory pathway predicted ATPase ExeA
MRTDVMDFFGLSRAPQRVGFFETAHQQTLIREISGEIRQGGLIAISGIVGCGKTTLLQRLRAELAQSKDIIVSRSLAVDKDRVSINTLMTALFYDLATEKDFKLPTQPEKRERKLIELIQKHRKLVVLLVDEAHDLHYQTLSKLKRLIELVRHNGGTLAVLLAGHPKLKNDLRRPNLEEIGARATIFSLNGIQGYQRDFINWLLQQCCADDVTITDVITNDAMSLLAERLSTPLQIEQYLKLLFEEGYKVGQKPITTEIIEMVLAQGLNDLEPTLIRHGYNARVIANLLNIRTTEVRSFLSGKLPEGRAIDLKTQMLKLGIPV